LELVCSACAMGDCKHHQPKIVARDRITGLEVEARCICKNCKTERAINEFRN